MQREAEVYHCPNSAENGEREHRARQVNAGLLIGRVMTALVGRIATDTAIGQLVKDIQTELSGQTGQHQGDLNAAENDISELNAAKLALLNRVEEGSITYPEAADAINDLNKTAAGLHYESMVARNELDRMRFICDGDGIAHTARDARTYLENPAPEYAQELLDLLVDHVQVAEDAAVVVYSTPLPAGERTEGVLSERIPLT